MNSAGLLIATGCLFILGGAVVLITVATIH
jgi:hypothetical protein